MIEQINEAQKKTDWDVYRKFYPSLSFQDCMRVSETFDQLWPHQAFFSLEAIQQIFDFVELNIAEAIKVIELGCHEGHLAKSMLGKYESIASWSGYDINHRALLRSVVDDDRYRAIALNDWFHHIELPEFNVFVSSHTLEHLDSEQAIKVFDQISEKAIFLVLEIPISEDGQDWQGYKGTHVLKEGRRVIRQIISQRKYVCFQESCGNYPMGWVTRWRKLVSDESVFVQ